jgi:hypothetical protein
MDTHDHNILKIKNVVDYNRRIYQRKAYLRRKAILKAKNEAKIAERSEKLKRMIANGEY